MGAFFDQCNTKSNSNRSRVNPLRRVQLAGVSHIEVLPISRSLPVSLRAKEGRVHLAISFVLAVMPSAMFALKKKPQGVAQSDSRPSGPSMRVLFRAFSRGGYLPPHVPARPFSFFPTAVCFFIKPEGAGAPHTSSAPPCHQS